LSADKRGLNPPPHITKIFIIMRGPRSARSRRSVKWGQGKKPFFLRRGPLGGLVRSEPFPPVTIIFITMCGPARPETAPQTGGGEQIVPGHTPRRQLPPCSELVQTSEERKCSTSCASGGGLEHFSLSAPNTNWPCRQRSSLPSKGAT
jgi:hypothetical protein